MQQEIVASIPLGVIFGVIGGSFCGLIARKTLGMNDRMFAIFTSCCMAGMLIALPLGAFFSSFRKIKVITTLLRTISVLYICIAFIPFVSATNIFGWHISFLLLLLFSWVCIASFTTLRASIWRANYPVQHRGQITVYVYFFITVFSSLSVWLFGKAMDGGMYFGDVYVISGLMGFIVAHIYSKIRIRGENKMISRNADQNVKVQVFAGFSMLFKDKAFGKFMSWQMLNGMATMVVEGGVMVLIFTEFFDVNMKEGAVVLGAIPLVISGLSAFFWARLFDRTDIFFMRFIGSCGWAIGRTMLFIAVFQGSYALAVFSRCLTGLGMGAGQLAWRLGHMHFAAPDKDSLYMGAHVGLTGIRGVLSPLIGVGIYSYLRKYNGEAYMIAGTAVLQFIVALAFLKMRKDYKLSKNKVL
ncbi:MAG: hypothetical protein JEZ07_14915 [Phycisphaerae bacterium]|nr:hypothetical protein [Phycisphaerae bacterium]